MKRIGDISISSLLVLGMGGCWQVLDVDANEYAPVCQTGELACEGNVPKTCVDGLWQALSACVGQTCISGQCRGDCEAGTKRCIENSTQLCDASGHFMEGSPCIGQGCVEGECVGECLAGSKDCLGNSPRSCGENGQWVVSAACALPKELCDDGECIAAPQSCVGLAAACGPNGDESCCAITKVAGGTYNRGNDAMYPALVGDFVLDRFEITVGRFRKFVEAYPGNKPIPGAGAHPLIAGSGWDAAWDPSLPTDKGDLISKIKCMASEYTWTDAPGANENKPMNCLGWADVFSFCVWDGGRLPTEAEWNYAAAGGDEQREYPWSNPPSSTMIDSAYAVFDCMGDGSAAGQCTAEDILNVGSKSKQGDGRWGQADLGGSVWEWNLDGHAASYSSGFCNNCANLSTSSNRVIRGGGWNDSAPILLSSSRAAKGPSYHYSFVGGRCARNPKNP